MIAASWCVGAILAVAVALKGLAKAPARAPAPETDATRRRPLRLLGTPAHVPNWWRRIRASRAARARRAAWPSVAEELAATLRAGASLRQALESAGARGGAAGDVLRGLLIPVERGEPLARCAHRWTEQAADPDEALLADAVHLAATRGRADPIVFDTVADTVRERAALTGELRAQTAQARASGGALAALPLAFTALVSLADPSVVTFLFGTTQGLSCLAIGLTLQTGGLWWMQRVVRSAAP